MPPWISNANPGYNFSTYSAGLIVGRALAFDIHGGMSKYVNTLQNGLQKRDYNLVMMVKRKHANATLTIFRQNGPALGTINTTPVGSWYPAAVFIPASEIQTISLGNYNIVLKIEASCPAGHNQCGIAMDIIDVDEIYLL